VGLAVGVAVIRGFVRRGGSAGIGNFWTDLVRGLLYVILPICTVATFFFVLQGVAQSVAGGSIGPVATWVANMLTGETIFGGIGSGLTGILLLELLAVFLAGLMVGRTPSFLGKRVESREVKLLILGTLAAPTVVLGRTVLATSTEFGAASRYAADTAQAFTEHLWAYASQTNNNGSAFAGYVPFSARRSPGRSTIARCRSTGRCRRGPARA
jgi:K+-transporting ATPase A subunit